MSAEEIETLLLRRRSVVVVAPENGSAPQDVGRHIAQHGAQDGTWGAADRRTAGGLTALEADLAARGHVLTAELRRALSLLPAARLAEAGGRLLADIGTMLGSDRTHRPLFRDFPHGSPRGEAHSLFSRRVRAYLAAQPDQPCMACGTVVPGVASLLGCAHLVCDRCWMTQGSACCEECCEWFGCPVCQERTPTGAPTDPRATPLPDPVGPPVVLRVLHRAPSREAAAQQELAGLLARRTPLDPQDHDNLRLLLAVAVGGDTCWLPEVVPLRESKALALHALLTAAEDPAAWEPVLRTHLDTATDVLRLLCVRSGADPDLLAPPARMPSLPRPLRRLLLSVLDGLRFAALTEDLGRHPQLWKRAAESLHPFEHAARHPRSALAFAALRGTAIRGGDALADVLLAEAAAHPLHVRLVGDRLRPVTWAGRVEAALALYDVEGAASLLAARPGELLRRLRHLLQIATFTAGAVPDALVDALAAALPRAEPGPLLGALGELRRARDTGGTPPGAGTPADGPRRVFFPRGSVAKAYTVPDRRLPLDPGMAGDLCALLEGEILDRLAPVDGEASGARYGTAVLDAGLSRVPLPTATRGRSAALVDIPRGSELAMPGDGERVRLFLHWTQPRGLRVDLDLSVAVYDGDRRFLGLCDYTNLSYAGAAAVHSGDFTSAPAPHGATEYVDLDLPRLARAGARHLVTVVFSYTDTPFHELPDAFAGFMRLAAADGDPAAAGARRRTRRSRARTPAPASQNAGYDPRAVLQRFELDGDAKISMPMTIDLGTRTGRWTDVTLPGHGAGDDLWRHRERLGALAGALDDTFGDGARVTLWDLACWRAAARLQDGGQVLVRDGTAHHSYRRRPGETVHAFANRVRERWTPETVAAGARQAPALDAGPGAHLFCALVHADLPGLPADATGTAYRLFPGPADASGLDRVAAGDLVAELAPRGV